jgi:enoyl-CoA hydratase/carnithine racemase
VPAHTVERLAASLETLTLEMRTRAAVLVFREPAMTQQVLDELAAVTADLADSSQVGGLIISGRGRTFSTGADLTLYQRAINDESIEIRGYAGLLTSALARVVVNLREASFPVIAAVNGQAAGAGFSLALACDYIIASRKAAFNFAYGRIGASPDGGMTWLLPRVVGPARAVQLLMEQPVLRAERAKAEGIVHQVVDAPDLMAACLDQLNACHAVAPHAIRAAKRLVHLSSHLPLAEHLDLERSMFADGLVTEDMRRGVDALLAGDWPEFEGR